jgi:hypothetical protein
MSAQHGPPWSIAGGVPKGKPPTSRGHPRRAGLGNEAEISRFTVQLGVCVLSSDNHVGPPKLAIRAACKSGGTSYPTRVRSRAARRDRISLQATKPVAVA